MEPPVIPQEISFNSLHKVLGSIVDYMNLKFDAIQESQNKLQEAIEQRPYLSDVVSSITSRYGATAEMVIDMKAAQWVLNDMKYQMQTETDSLQNQITQTREEASTARRQLRDQLQNCYQTANKAKTQSKRSLNHTSQIALRLYTRARKTKLFNAWHDMAERTKKRRILLRQYFRTHFRRFKQMKFARWQEIWSKHIQRKIDQDLHMAVKIAETSQLQLEQFYTEFEDLKSQTALKVDVDRLWKFARQNDNVFVKEELSKKIKILVDKIKDQQEEDRKTFTQNQRSLIASLETRGAADDIKELQIQVKAFNKETTNLSQTIEAVQAKFDGFDPTPKMEELENDLNRMKFISSTNQLDIKKVTESLLYYANYSKATSTKGWFSCGNGKNLNATDTGPISTNGLLGSDQRLYKGDPGSNNPMMPGRKRAALNLSQDSQVKRVSRSREARPYTTTKNPLLGVPIYTPKVPSARPYTAKTTQ